MRIQPSSKPTAAQAAQAAPVAPAAAAPRRAPLEADVRLKGTMQGDVLATGQVTLTRPFMELLVRYLTRKPKSFGKSDVKWDPQSGTYKGTVVVKIKGKYPITLDAQAKPVVSGNQPGFQLSNVGIQLFGRTVRLPFFTDAAAKLIAKEIGYDIPTTVAKGGIVQLDPTGLMHEIDALPPALRMAAGNKWSAAVEPDGDVVLKLDGGVAGAAPANTAASDLDALVEKGTMMKVLRPMLGNDFQLQDITFGQNTIALAGLVEAKPLSDLANAGKAILAAIIAARGGRVGHVSETKAMIPLTLNVRLDGMQATLTPSLGPALKELEKTLTKAGIKYTKVDRSLRFDLTPMVARYGVKSLQATPAGLEAKAALDIPGLFKAPMLRDGVKAIGG